MNALHRAGRTLIAFLACAGIAVLPACATSMTFGSSPKVQALPALKVGASNSGDVMKALGEPRGRGLARFSSDLPEQDVWFYEYMQTDGRKVQLKMLLVFVEKDRYVGHMWFSSNQLMGETK